MTAARAVGPNSPMNRMPGMNKALMAPPLNTIVYPYEAAGEMAERSFTSRTHGGGLDLHALCPPHEEKLEIHQLRRAELVRFRPHADQAVPQAALERADVLPLEAVDRIAGRMRLRDDAAGEVLARVLVVALGAGKIDLTLWALKQRSPGIQVGF